MMNEFLIAVDSDGCVFNNMGREHIQCFAPQFVKYFNLQRIALQARYCWEYVNLNSYTRGINRFAAIPFVMELLKSNPYVQEINFPIPKLESLNRLIAQGAKLCYKTIQEEADKNNDPELKTILEWSNSVNRSIAQVAQNIPPLHIAKKNLSKMRNFADVIVVSQAPYLEIRKRWTKYKLNKYVLGLYGQEKGSKEHFLGNLTKFYDKNKMLMIGDTIFDMRAAENNGILFYPIIPRYEEYSWKRFYNESVNKFFEGSYEGKYEDKLIEEFKECFTNRLCW